MDKNGTSKSPVSRVFKNHGVLSFKRGLCVSDGVFFNVFSDLNGKKMETPLLVIRHGIRGTQNVNKQEKGTDATASESIRREVANIQQTDSAKTDLDANKLGVSFNLRVMDLADAIHSAVPTKEDPNNEFKESILNFLERAKQSDGLAEVSLRIARNLLNGRWLWRNRSIAHCIDIDVKDNVENNFLCQGVKALTISMNDFSGYTKEENDVAKYILDGFLGVKVCNVQINAYLDFGFKGAIEVFPSQNYLPEKAKGFSRSLYCLKSSLVTKFIESISEDHSIKAMGVAALRDQKISNALRTIDTWYEDYPKRGKPIPVEPNGANLEESQFFRRSSSKTSPSSFDIVKRLNETDPSSPDGMFFIANMIRGGVY